MKNILQALRGQPTPRPPFWLMRQAGRYLPEYREQRKQAGSFWNLCFTPERAAEVTLQPIRRFGMDAAILFSDILVIPHALGRRVTFVEGEGPKLEPMEANDIAKLSYNPAALEPIMDTVSRVSSKLDGNTALIGFAGAPWTVAAYMCEGEGSREYAKARMFAHANASLFLEMLDRITAATLEYLIAQVRAGAEAVQIFDSWAGVLSPEEYRHYVIGPTRRLVEGMKNACPEVPVIGFARGNSAMLAEYAAKTGVNAVGVDTATPLEWAAKAMPETVLQGNLDPLLLVADGGKAAAHAMSMRETMKSRPYVFNLGHGIVPQTPVAHVEALCNALRR